MMSGSKCLFYGEGCCLCLGLYECGVCVVCVHAFVGVCVLSLQNVIAHLVRVTLG